MFLGQMAYPDPKGERNSSMPGKRQSCSGVRGEVSRDPCDMAQAGLPEAESPENAKIRPPERHSIPAPRSVTASFACCCNLRGVERCPVRAIKEMSRTPKSRSDVQQGRTRDRGRGVGAGVIVIGNMASICGLEGCTGHPQYSAAKAGILGFTRLAAKELIVQGIRVNAVAPGFVDTSRLRGALDSNRQANAARTPVGRLGTPEEIAATVAFLASDDAAYFVGATLSPNGGLLTAV